MEREIQKVKAEYEEKMRKKKEKKKGKDDKKDDKKDSKEKAKDDEEDGQAEKEKSDKVWLGSAVKFALLTRDGLDQGNSK